MTDRLFRVLVTGSRKWANQDAVWDALDIVAKEHGWPIIVIHGCAEGADWWAHTWAEAYHHVEWRFPAAWAHEGRAAGPRRNRRMIAEGEPDLVLAFPEPGSKGTLDMVDLAKRAGTPVIDFTTKEDA